MFLIKLQNSYLFYYSLSFSNNRQFRSRISSVDFRFRFRHDQKKYENKNNLAVFRSFSSLPSSQAAAASLCSPSLLSSLSPPFSSLSLLSPTRQEARPSSRPSPLKPRARTPPLPSHTRRPPYTLRRAAQDQTPGSCPDTRPAPCTDPTTPPAEPDCIGRALPGRPSTAPRTLKPARSFLPRVKKHQSICFFFPHYLH
jgi:hypothetical protein